MNNSNNLEVSIFCPYSLSDLRRFKDSLVSATSAFRRLESERNDFHDVLDDLDELHHILSRLERNAIAMEENKAKEYDLVNLSIQAFVEDIEQIQAKSNFTELETKQIRFYLLGNNSVNAYDKARIHDFLNDNKRFISPHQENIIKDALLDTSKDAAQEQRIQDALEKNKEVVENAKDIELKKKAKRLNIALNPKCSKKNN
ncbi:hypothetical protein V9L05_20490 [Bernardetia sp. Wsw4-3y2]|uniref:hypothetical protein n=1 Tax=Bernardetia sp. Wsw4-3y2 TaxID=3127471 RepID=UPI0030CDE22B